MKSLSWQRYQGPVHRGVSLKISRKGSAIKQKKRPRTWTQVQCSWLIQSETMKNCALHGYIFLNEMRSEIVEYEEGKKEV